MTFAGPATLRTGRCDGAVPVCPKSGKGPLELAAGPQVRATLQKWSAICQATFYTIDGEEVEIDMENVVRMSAGEEDETTVLELEDGSEVTVAATQLEVAAELGLNPLDYIDPEDDDELIERLIDDDDANEPGL